MWGDLAGQACPVYPRGGVVSLLQRLSVCGAIAIAALHPTNRSRAEEPIWPVGQLFLTASTDLRFPCHNNWWTNDTLDVFLVAAIDFEAIGAPERNATNSLGGWRAKLLVGDGFSVLEQALMPAGSTDADPDPFEYDVTLGQTTLVGDGAIRLLRLRVAFTSLAYQRIQIAPLESQQFQAYPGGRPGWLDVGEHAECASPCWRPFQGTYVLGELVGAPWVTEFCGPDRCSSHFERPLGGEVWEGKTDQTVLYSSTTLVDDIQFTVDGGEHWQSLASVGYWTSGHTAWSVPNVDTDNAQLRLCDDCCWFGPYYEESGTFRIVKRVGERPSSWGSIKALYGR